MKQFARFVIAGLLSLTFGFANAAIIYFADDQGNVGRYNDVTLAVAPVGSLTPTFSVSQVIGIAWDANNNRILLLDRSAPAVYAMNPTTGVPTLLFNPGIEFQGGAVVGSLLYGINEGTQTVQAFSLTTFANQNLTPAALTDHTHGMGVNPTTGQLYLGGGTTIRTSSAAGEAGPAVVSTSIGFEDVDYYGGDFLVVSYGSDVQRVDGTTGTATTFLTSGQVSSAGVTGNVSGVVVAGGAVVTPTAIDPVAPIPTLNEWGIMLLCLLLAGSGLWFVRRARS